MAKNKNESAILRNDILALKEEASHVTYHQALNHCSGLRIQQL
jgi:hypothetical protein